MSFILEAVTLCLYDEGPLTLNQISEITCLPLPTLLTHLQLNRGTRYLARLTIEDDIPVRRWELAPTSHPPEETDE